MPIDPNLQFQNMTALSQGGVVYNAGLKRYIYSTWTGYTLEFYEAPQPWGPWTHFQMKDFGAFPWTEEASGGYGVPIPSKFISEDGRTMWMHSNVWQAGVIHYQYSLRQIHVNAYVPSTARNERSAEPVSTEQHGAVPLVRSSHSGHVEFLNDGVAKNQSLESWTGERKDEDYWGFTWPQVLHVNKVRYTTGDDSARGGWFDELSVQVRHGRDWVAVSSLTITPDYRADRSVLGYKTFTLSFDETVTDGVRIFGRPGGSDYSTNVAELGIYYE
jgi:hypothetical protein